jgi:hypothetical protein
MEKKLELSHIRKIEGGKEIELRNIRRILKEKYIDSFN